MEQSEVAYMRHAKEAILPILERPATVSRRDGNMTRVRRHHMSLEDQLYYREEAKKAGRFVAPFRKGSYFGVVESLSLLGENKIHKFSDFWTKYIEVMNEAAGKGGKTQWEAFIDKPLRNQISGKNAIDRVNQNIRVLQRLGGMNPYGLKLAQLNACIDVFGPDENSMSLSLRTGIPDGDRVIPVREIRKKSFEPVTFVKAGISVVDDDYSFSDGISDIEDAGVSE